MMSHLSFSILLTFISLSFAIGDNYFGLIPIENAAATNINKNRFVLSMENDCDEQTIDVRILHAL